MFVKICDLQNHRYSCEHEYGGKAHQNVQDDPIVMPITKTN